MTIRRVLERFLPSAIIVAVVGALFSQTRHYGLLGFDCYPIIITSRIESLRDQRFVLIQISQSVETRCLWFSLCVLCNSAVQLK